MPGSSPLSRHLESRVDPGNEVVTGNFSSGRISKLCGLCKFTRKLTDVNYELIIYARFTRMSPEHCEDHLTLVGPFIAKKPCRLRSSISEAERLMVTLRYLATGDSQQSLSFLFRIEKDDIKPVKRNMRSNMAGS